MVTTELNATDTDITTKQNKDIISTEHWRHWQASWSTLKNATKQILATATLNTETQNLINTKIATQHTILTLWTQHTTYTDINNSDHTCIIPSCQFFTAHVTTERNPVLSFWATQRQIFKTCSLLVNFQVWHVITSFKKKNLAETFSFFFYQKVGHVLVAFLLISRQLPSSNPVWPSKHHLIQSIVNKTCSFYSPSPLMMLLHTKQMLPKSCKTQFETVIKVCHVVGGRTVSEWRWDFWSEC